MKKTTENLKKWTIDQYREIVVADLRERLNFGGFNVENYHVGKSTWYLEISYHVLSELGYYVGYVFFKVRFPKYGNLFHFKITFNNDRSRYLARKYDLYYFLEDTIVDTLVDLSDYYRGEK